MSPHRSMEKIDRKEKANPRNMEKGSELEQRKS